MRKYIAIGCGGFAGAVLRSLLEGLPIPGYHEALPLSTLFINLFGAFLMAFLLNAALDLWTADPDIRLGVTTGGLGAFTTFSTLCKETTLLLFQGAYVSAVTYLAASALLGLAAAYLGTLLARALANRLSRGEIGPEDEREAE